MTYLEARKLFGLTGRPSQETVESRYKALAQEHHPDVGGDGETMKRVNQARDILLGRAKEGQPEEPTRPTWRPETMGERLRREAREREQEARDQAEEEAEQQKQDFLRDETKKADIEAQRQRVREAEEKREAARREKAKRLAREKEVKDREDQLAREKKAAEEAKLAEERRREEIRQRAIEREATNSRINDLMTRGTMVNGRRAWFYMAPAEKQANHELPGPRLKHARAKGTPCYCGMTYHNFMENPTLCNAWRMGKTA